MQRVGSNSLICLAQRIGASICSILRQIRAAEYYEQVRAATRALQPRPLPQRWLNSMLRFFGMEPSAMVRERDRRISLLKRGVTVLNDTLRRTRAENTQQQTQLAQLERSRQSLRGELARAREASAQEVRALQEKLQAADVGLAERDAASESSSTRLQSESARVAELQVCNAIHFCTISLLPRGAVTSMACMLKFLSGSHRRPCAWEPLIQNVRNALPQSKHESGRQQEQRECAAQTVCMFVAT